VIVFLGGLTVALFLLDQVSVSWAFGLDKRVIRYLSHHRTTGETHVMRGASLLGGPYGIFAVTVLGALSLYSSGRRKTAILYFLSVTLSIAFALAMKLMTGRKRPLHGLEKQRTYSFPSAHSLVSTVAYLSLGFLAAPVLGFQGEIVLLCSVVLLIISIGASRVYLGAHYPSDVLAGFLAGAAWVWIFLYLVA